MTEAADVVVVGSANLDVVLSVESIPRPGETVVALGRAEGPGGKGANQAVAAARSGARTTFVGAVGSDAGGAVLRDALSGSGVDVSAVRTATAPTGTAYVVVDSAGENCIVVDAGANGVLTTLVEVELAAVATARVLLCQLEIPVETVRAAAEHARAAGVLTVLNAAPAQQLPAALLAALDVLVVNEQECLALAPGTGSVQAAVAALLQSVPEVLVTLGAAGALLAQRDSDPVRVPPVPARTVVDTTGAGDTFCGAYAAARARGNGAADAARIACAAASLSVEKAGAAASAPTRSEIMARLAEG